MLRKSNVYAHWVILFLACPTSVVASYNSDQFNLAGSVVGAEIPVPKKLYLAVDQAVLQFFARSNRTALGFSNRTLLR